MSKNASFKVDPKLAELLGDTYKSTEDATKELIDNAYDADAENIWITLPETLAYEPEIIIKDDGTGMKEQELRSEYLKIASSRLSRKGDRTNGKGRKVKGRKGIGKFSGLMVASEMIVSTKAGGKNTTLTISKEELTKEKFDLEKVKLPIVVADCDKDEHGTTITLKGLNQNFTYPNSDKLKQLLIWDYRQVADLNIYVNGEKIGVQDYEGETVEQDIQLAEGITAKLIYTIAPKPVAGSGIIYRVGNKIVGKPINFMKDDPLIPEKLHKRVVGEVVCDSLEDFVTADWSAIVENSKLDETIRSEVKSEIKTSLDTFFKTDMKLAKARYQKKINEELSNLPEYKREFAERALQKILERFYGEPEEKVNVIISVMVDAMEKDYYWNVIQNIEESRDGDIEKLADALQEFGLLEISMIASQATNRLKFLDELDLLNSSKETLEATIHKALENNLWVLGSEYSLIFSNKSLKTAIKKMLDKKFDGERADKRPDLFLGEDVNRRYLLVEFKRPSVTIDRDAESQALKYRDDLNSVIHGKSIIIFVIGGKVDASISSHNERPDVKLMTYTDLISTARTQLNWLLHELRTIEAKPLN